MNEDEWQEYERRRIADEILNLYAIQRRYMYGLVANFLCSLLMFGTAIFNLL
jgi:hypothetical protein